MLPGVDHKILVRVYLIFFNSSCSFTLRTIHIAEHGAIVRAWQGLVGMKKVTDRASHGADGAFVEERYVSTDHVYAFVGGDVKVDVGAYCLHCCLRLA